MNATALIRAGYTTLILGLVLVFAWHSYLWMDTLKAYNQELAGVDRNYAKKKTGLGLVDALGQSLAESEKARLEERTDEKVGKITRDLLKWSLVVVGLGAGLLIVGYRTIRLPR